MKKILYSATVIYLFLFTAFGEERGIDIDSKTCSQLKIGKQYLFLIAIDRYDDWRPLKNPVQDAREIKEILSSRYVVDSVFELYDKDATKGNILRTFNDLQNRLKTEDSLFIYYAGHGYFDRTVSNNGFWIPANGGTDIYEQTNWIPNSQIRGIIGNFKAVHILLVSDSCFSGDILDTVRGEELSEKEIDDARVIKTYSLTSRQVLTSGSDESVPDYSEFSLQLKMALRKNTEPYLDPISLYNQIRKGVRSTLPLIGDLKETGHQDGASFYLFLKHAASYGTVSVSVKTGGKLFMDGSFLKEIRPGESFSIDAVKTGKHVFKMEYKNGKTESRDFDIVENQNFIAFKSREELGSFRVTAKIRAKLYIDKQFAGEVDEIGFKRDDVPSGEYEAEAVYEDLKTEKQKFVVKDNEETEVSFSYVPPILPETGEKTAPENKEESEVSISPYMGVGCGITIPVGTSAGLYGLALMPLVNFGIDIAFDWGSIGAGLVSGANIESTNDSGAYIMHDLYSLPIGAYLKITKSIFDHFNVNVEASGGMTASIVYYKSGDSNPDVLVIRPFFGCAAGPGYVFSNNIGVSLYCAYMMIFFAGDAYMGVTPGLRIDVRF